MELRVRQPHDSWACNARRFNIFTETGCGCLSGNTNYHQNQYNQGFKCPRCDFDICLDCALKYKRVDFSVLLSYEKWQHFVIFTNYNQIMAFKTFDEKEAKLFYDYFKTK